MIKMNDIIYLIKSVKFWIR